MERLIAAQFPHWAGLPVRPAEPEGWDNRTYRLGESMSVRLPTASGYVPAVAKESEWLPRLAPHLPVRVPTVLAVGRPGEGYPFPWSVRGWIDGQAADRAPIGDLPGFAVAVAEFLHALEACEAEDAPAAGEHSWFRGAAPAHYDDETRYCLRALEGRIDTAAAESVWAAALEADWTEEPVWFHGDVAAANLLVADGELAAVIDFGTSGIGDPACDLVIAWTMFAGESREAFRRAVAQDDGMWARARGWALWKALLGLAESDSANPHDASNLRIVADLIEDHARMS
ncbi:aminoglycoside phosphotransferase family protein [Sinomonas atrocyanea]|uniref:aminoglycoside phosphotransferase family protein n=1 Tax=Sinomonas atrocyanea TaxID=37927 RepID=UPI0027826BED|nr:aminoglycoside phosphotransferase family protein [Sinomonas atrocyanea]MDQ0261416.1 aminoglycoside phosphotransferase (APT) family kinase protein [Sinomonas atrocyanea]MDR6623529.1 aminoglycoside phosphotransferase (APT) family kinase protein [Sinomonas atrocyanea]